ncbi:PspC domain-containing protein [Pedobacter insulae]|uniref:Phage shock protein PspC (Stress-responsive transcriptional regulator) n=1 Tax=Pedobacter insulae TaxID=414048 RepID=A0A1I2TKR1_9SPHI|nr:PspC domain-containing protein [Pedobacter insulae]SFG65502.1 Phage shock protein PspC (stress-responsive transcriptional regulator) [Pedobacter insulae]
MKKTIIINIGNSIVHIEEDGYEVLTAYLNEIKQHFAKTADDFEIVTDIENRIAEMFAEILQAGQVQVITLVDVERVIAQMGRVQDFETAEDEPVAANFANYAGDKKLYRDTDDAMLAGVCSGLSHYLNIEARWVRIIALCCIFLGGAGVLVYLILWIAIPRAVTRSERMEMKGESTNLYGYNRKFEEELAAFKDNMQSSPSFKRSGNFITEIISAIGRAANALGRILSKTIAGIIIVMGFAFLLSLVFCLAAFLGFWDTEAYQYFPLSVINEDYRSTLAFAAFAILFVPVLALVLFSIRVAFNKTAINKTLSFGLLIIWLVSVSVGVYYAAKISSEFKEHAELVQTTPIIPFKTYILDADQSMVFNREDSIDFQLDKGGFQNRIIVDDSDDHPFRVPRNVHIRIEKSETGKHLLVQNYEAQGKTFNIALQNAKNISHTFIQKDSTLTFSPRILLKNNANWRNQEVHLTLKVPVGTRLMLNDNIYKYLNFYHYNCTAEEYQKGVYREWIMTEDGIKCRAELDKPLENQ